MQSPPREPGIHFSAAPDLPHFYQAITDRAADRWGPRLSLRQSRRGAAGALHAPSSPPGLATSGVTQVTRAARFCSPEPCSNFSGHSRPSKRPLIFQNTLESARGAGVLLTILLGLCIHTLSIKYRGKLMDRFSRRRPQTRRDGENDHGFTFGRLGLPFRSGTQAFARNTDGNTVSVIDTGASTGTAAIPAGSCPLFQSGRRQNFMPDEIMDTQGTISTRGDRILARRCGYGR